MHKKIIVKILDSIDVKINGKRSWDIQVKDEHLYTRVVKYGSLGLGESYVDGWWECQRLDIFFDKVLSAGLQFLPEFQNWRMALLVTQAVIFNAGSKLKAFSIGKKHYDIGNDLFRFMLGDVMAYSCGYWKGADNLESAQIAKFELICKKMNLTEGMSVLDVGCGWGELAKYMAQNYGVKVVGVTVSREQAKMAREKVSGLDVQIELKDYRDIKGRFDRVVSVGMFEHVGYKNYRKYMEVVSKLLKKDGLFLLHTIGGNKSVKTIDPWIGKYIFPGGMLPSIAQIGKSIESIFIMEDWHNFGPDYDKTLMAWSDNFEKHWPELKNKYGDRFYRLWKYYLLSCAGVFRSRQAQLWQIVLTKNGLRGGYHSIR